MELVNMNSKTTNDANSALVIVYNNNRAGIDFHDDGESLIDGNSSTATVTFGSSRTIEFCDHTLRPRIPLHSIVCDNRDMLIMKTGCQKALVHRVCKGNNLSDSQSNEFRVVISFRKITGDNVAQENLEDSQISVNLDPPNAAILPSLVTPQHTPKKITVVAGDSFTAGLDANRLGRNGRKTVVNISRGGASVGDVEKQFDTFYMSLPDTDNTPVVEKVIVCVGTNDIRNCRENGVRHLKRPLITLIEKIKLLFPDSNIWFQSLIPLPVQNQFTIANVEQFNSLLFEVCSYMKIYFLNIFHIFLKYDRERRGLFRSEFYYVNNKNIHLNKFGLGLLARAYIRVIHSNRFNPLGY